MGAGGNRLPPRWCRSRRGNPRSLEPPHRQGSARRSGPSGSDRRRLLHAAFRSADNGLSCAHLLPCEPSGSGEPDGRLCNLGRRLFEHRSRARRPALVCGVSGLPTRKFTLPHPSCGTPATLVTRGRPRTGQPRAGERRTSHHLRWRARSRSSARGTPRTPRPCSPRAASMTASCWVARRRS